MSFSDSRANVAAGIAIAALLTLCWMIYSPALGGTFLFDDWHNLSGLSKISDFNSALQYVLSGTAGPSGRPLALATFAFQAAQWGGSASPFLQINILIHLLNGLLVYLFFLQLAHTQRVSSVDAQLVAITAVAFWLFMPLLASSTLMVVQRMATLSACFMLVGLNCYLWFRTRIDLNPHTALFAMGLTIAFATSLAILAKENGALLPSLILVLELTLLRRPAGIDLGKWRSWQLAFLLLPTLAIATFLILQTPYSRAMVLQKDFTAWERLLTEAQILWQYLFHAAVAKPFEFGPFHDDYLISRSILEPLTFLAIAAWVAVLAGRH
ncbi:MAG TPA: hypothetical protein PKK10_04250 [Woeseiaceae bacterium]|nr:hypothetical protein [Woeseiaceae bacterium]